jgi:hypothetical protein
MLADAPLKVFTYAHYARKRARMTKRHYESPEFSKHYIKSFGPGEDPYIPVDPTSRSGFYVFDNNGPEEEKDKSYLRCYEGYTHGLGPPEDIEDDVLEVESIAVYAPKEHEEDARPEYLTGTELLRIGIVEGRARNLNLGRAIVINPAFIKILSKLQGEGLVGEIRCVLPRATPDEPLVTTPEILNNTAAWDAQQAMDYLNTTPEGASVSCAFEIA